MVKYQAVPILVNGNPFQEVESQKYLEIIFHKELNWGAQASE